MAAGQASGTLIKVTQSAVRGVLVLEPRVFGDERGFFLESYNRRAMEQVGITYDFVQDNHSFSTQNVIRGLHYQVQRPQGKLIRVVLGDILDVAVDLRRSSPTFGRHEAVRLSGDNKKTIWIPPGCAHGFRVISDGAHVIYKTTDYYFPEFEHTVAWNDPELGIDWQLSGPPIISAKDKKGVPFRKAEFYE